MKSANSILEFAPLIVSSFFITVVIFLVIIRNELKSRKKKKPVARLIVLLVMQPLSGAIFVIQFLFERELGVATLCYILSTALLAGTVSQIANWSKKELS